MCSATGATMRGAAAFCGRRASGPKPGVASGCLNSIIGRVLGLNLDVRVKQLFFGCTVERN